MRYYFMTICPICRINEANKKNSHLIPWFMIKKTVTEKGTGERNKELSFTIDPDQLTRIFIGQSVLPENVEEFDELHQAQQEVENPYSRDYLICISCEEKLSRIEAIYASRFTEKKISNSNTSFFSSNNVKSVLVDLKYHNSTYELLIQSIFYRCSIGRFSGFKLDTVIEEKIEENLRMAFATPSFSKINESTQIVLPYSFPLITSILDMSDITDKTKSYITIEHSRYPYFIIAGQWILQMYEKEKNIKSNVEWLFGLKAMFDHLAFYGSLKNKSHVIILSKTASQTIVGNIVDYMADKKIIGIKRNIKCLHLLHLKKKPSVEIVNYLSQRWIFHSYTKDDLACYAYAFNDLRLLPDYVRY